MELILDLLRRLPDYPRLRTALESGAADRTSPRSRD